MPNFGQVRVAQVVVEILVPFVPGPPPPPPAGPYPIKITLRGVNRRPACANDQPEYRDVPKAPSVKRAL